MIRTSKPESGNKYFNTKSNGGYSTCIVGKPTDKGCNVLANCVGYASGAFNEQLGLGYEKYNLNCNAENFIERAISKGLSISQQPVLGGVMVWQKGATLSGKDGAGHVAFVHTIVDTNTVITGDSGYNSSAYWNTRRSKGSGNWGQASSYKYRGCIVPPNYTPTPTPEPSIDTPPCNYTVQSGDTVASICRKFYNGKSTENEWNLIKDANGLDNNYTIHSGQVLSIPVWKDNIPEPTPVLKYKVGDKVVFSGVLYEKADGSNPGQSRSNLVCTITKTANGSKPYNIDNGLGWVAESDLTPYTEPAQPVQKIPTGAGVKIVLNGTKYASSANGNGVHTAADGWTRKVLAYHAGAQFPYQVGLNNATTGFFKESQLKQV